MTNSKNQQKIILDLNLIKKSPRCFKILNKDGKARAGILKTKSGEVKTPFFMPVATKAVGRYIGSEDYNEIGFECLISNSFIMNLNPGSKLIGELGGLNKFMSFKGSCFTDSGGFQMLREGFFEKVTKRAVHLRNPDNNQKLIITPTSVMDTEFEIYSDIAMVIDDVAPYGSSKEHFEKSLINTHNWAKIQRIYHEKLDPEHKQLVFGIVQGGFYKDLRERSAKYINKLDFDGVAIGGVAIGETKEEMYLAINNSLPYIDEHKCRYAMGVGSPENIVKCVSLGIDCFDSIYPTKCARHSMIFTWKGRIDLKKGKWAKSKEPLDKECDCKVCKNYTKAYLRQLLRIKSGEGYRLVQYHNLYFMKKLMEKIRKNIIEGTFEKFKIEFLKYYDKNKKFVGTTACTLKDKN